MFLLKGIWTCDACQNVTDRVVSGDGGNTQMPDNWRGGSNGRCYCSLSCANNAHKLHDGAEAAAETARAAYLKENG